MQFETTFNYRKFISDVKWSKLKELVQYIPLQAASVHL